MIYEWNKQIFNDLKYTFNLCVNRFWGSFVSCHVLVCLFENSRENMNISLSLQMFTNVHIKFNLWKSCTTSIISFRFELKDNAFEKSTPRKRFNYTHREESPR